MFKVVQVISCLLVLCSSIKCGPQVLKNVDGCEAKVCHEKAICVNKDFGPICICKYGLYGDGEKSCDGKSKIFLKPTNLKIYDRFNYIQRLKIKRMWIKFCSTKCGSNNWRNRFKTLKLACYGFYSNSNGQRSDKNLFGCLN